MVENFRSMVGIAQLVEHLVVVQGAAGSSPVTHPSEHRERCSKVSVSGLSGNDLCETTEGVATLSEAEGAAKNPLSRRRRANKKTSHWEVFCFKFNARRRRD